MNQQGSSDYRKILVVVLVLVILLGAIVVIRAQRNAALQKSMEVQKVAPTIILSPTSLPLVGEYSFSGVPVSVKVGQTFNVSIDFKAPKTVLDGADAYVRFNPTYLKADSVTEGPYFSEYLRKTIDNEEGMVKVTGFRSKTGDTLDKNVTFFTLSLTAQKSGLTNLTFDFQKGRTNLSTLVEKGTSRNVLGTTGKAVIAIAQ
ncbi:MAG: cohesin domain-containing protein [Patescibacteria group bacterium]|nr:cohesin domain-containing protein [Patescibacteria group bacterium]